MALNDPQNYMLTISKASDAEVAPFLKTGRGTIVFNASNVSCALNVGADKDLEPPPERDETY